MLSRKFHCQSSKEGKENESMATKVNFVHADDFIRQFVFNFGVFAGRREGGVMTGKWDIFFSGVLYLVGKYQVNFFLAISFSSCFPHRNHRVDLPDYRANVINDFLQLSTL